jgi:hypothetical protein
VLVEPLFRLLDPAIAVRPLVAEGALSGERLIATMFYQGQLMDQFQSVLNTFSSLYKTSGAAAKARPRNQ